MSTVQTLTPVYGLMAEFETPTEILVAAKRAYAEGYRKMDAYSPQPVHGLSEAIGFEKNRVALVCLAGGVLGLLTAYALQFWVNLIEYPLNIGGRPLHSWPSFVIVCFELTILFGGLAAAIGMLAMNGLPMPYHPVFNVAQFAHASRDRFFLCIETADPKFDMSGTRAFLESLGPHSIAEVPY
jgi:Alternative complex III, ActD subunit